MPELENFRRRRADELLDRLQTQRAVKIGRSARDESHERGKDSEILAHSSGNQDRCDAGTNRGGERGR
jgi:hypothetical protein